MLKVEDRNVQAAIIAAVVPPYLDRLTWSADDGGETPFFQSAPRGSDGTRSEGFTYRLFQGGVDCGKLSTSVRFIPDGSDFNVESHAFVGLPKRTPLFKPWGEETDKALKAAYGTLNGIYDVVAGSIRPAVGEGICDCFQFTASPSLFSEAASCSRYLCVASLTPEGRFIGILDNRRLGPRE